MNPTLKKAVKEAFDECLNHPEKYLQRLTDGSTPPKNIADWLASLLLLHGVPFRYLVPDERMLPPESIRFFHLDVNWMNALWDGAYSIGRYVTKETPQLSHLVEGAFAKQVKAQTQKAFHARRAKLLKKIPTELPESNTKVTGFLLRSEVVAGWKGLQVNAYTKEQNPDNPNWDGSAIEILRLEHLSDSILLGFFKDEVYRLDIHEPSEGLHYGFDLDDNEHLCKSLRNQNGTTLTPPITLSNSDLKNHQIFRSNTVSNAPNTGGQVINLYKLSKLMFETLKPNYLQPSARVHDVNSGTDMLVKGLDDNANALLSSEFALQLIEGVGMVSFINDEKS